MHEQKREVAYNQVIGPPMTYSSTG